MMPPKFSKERTLPTSFEGSRPTDQTKTSPCEAACPAGHDIQRTIYLIKNNRFEEALQNVRAKHPFPGICGRACFHPCETPCNRQFYDQRISIRALERAAFDLADRSKTNSPIGREKTGKKVAIIGSGPAGMTCAYFSALFGHDVTIFEALPFLGGMTRIGIPDHRLPKDVVDEEVGEILKLGIETRTGVRVGSDISFQEIRNQYDVCLIATGAWKEKHLDIPGSEFAIQALSFLSQVAKGERPVMGKKVLIVGGGGVAFDVATTIRRLGDSEVHVACLESRDSMVASQDDIEHGEEEGVIIHNSKTFKRIVIEQGQVKGIECMDVGSFQFDESGNLQVDPIQGSDHIMPADTILCAIGEEPDLGFLQEAEGFKLSELGTLLVEEKTLSTSVEGVFAAGDAITGPSSVAESIGKGRLAAIAMDCYLTGKRMEDIRRIYFDHQGNMKIDEFAIDEKRKKPQEVVGYDEILNPNYYEKEEQVKMRRLLPPESLTSFEEVNKGYTEEEAVKEANRCFRCGHCAECGTCEEICPLDVIAMGDEGPIVAYPKECWHCGGCRINCPCGCISYEFPLSMLL
jgi:NADPH-dependent glutamate synthase beta subunit-like oxidoreductase